MARPLNHTSTKTLKEFMKTPLLTVLAYCSVTFNILAIPIAHEDRFVPWCIRPMLEWPSTGKISQQQDTSISETEMARGDAEKWLRRVIDASLVPTNLEPLCIKADFAGADVVRYRWVSEGRHIMVAQTWSTFVMQVDRIASRHDLTGSNIHDEVDDLKSIAQAVFVKTGHRYGGVDKDYEEKRIIINDLNKQIAEVSFKVTNVFKLQANSSNGFKLYGSALRGTHKEEMRVSTNAIAQPATNRIEVRTEGQMLQCWIENVEWVADEHRIVFFFPKLDGPETTLKHIGVSASPWFQKPKSRLVKSKNEEE